MSHLIEIVPDKHAVRGRRPPKQADGGPVHVHAGVQIHSINAVDMKQQLFDMELQIDLTWYDTEFMQLTKTAKWEAQRQELGWREQMLCVGRRPAARLVDLASGTANGSVRPVPTWALPDAIAAQAA